MLLKQGILEPVLYGGLVFKFTIIIGKPSFSDQFKKIRELSGSMVECLTRDRGPWVRVSPALLRCALEQEQ